MNKRTKSTRALLLVLILLAMFLFVAAKPAAPGANGLNARFIRFHERENIIHLFFLDSSGNSSSPPAVVPEGQKVIMGFEWTDALDVLNGYYNDETGVTVTVSIDGGPPVDARYGYQEPFLSVPRSGPRWSWDHDGDGLGDGDGDGVGDWNAPVMFFRYAAPDLAPGIHTFDFVFTFPDTTITEQATVDVVSS